MTLTVVQQATVIAALISFLGVVAIGVLAHLRESRKFRTERLSAYRSEARTTIKNVLVAAAEFERHGRVMSDMWRWITLGYDAGSRLAESTEDSMRCLANELELASLTLAEPTLQVLVLELQVAFHRAAGHVHASADEFLGLGADDRDQDSREVAWREFTSARLNLVAEARGILRSPVRAG